MTKRKTPELTFQQHIADYLIREHRYGVLEQSDITDTEHFIAEDHLWALLCWITSFSTGTGISVSWKRGGFNTTEDSLFLF